MAPKTKPAVLATPDTLGEAGLAELGARSLHRLQIQRADLLEMKAVNGHTDEDGVPKEDGGFLTSPEGSVITYREREGKLNEAIRNLLKAHEGHRELLDAAVERLRKNLYGAEA